VYQVGRGSDPMIDVGSITLAEPLNMRPSLILLAQACAWLLSRRAREINPAIGRLCVAFWPPAWQTIANSCHRR
jgi:hypothetical protein